MVVFFVVVVVGWWWCGGGGCRLRVGVPFMLTDENLFVWLWWLSLIVLSLLYSFFSQNEFDGTAQKKIKKLLKNLHSCTDTMNSAVARSSGIAKAVKKLANRHKVRKT